jgi:fused signal recognition particle receptor
MKFFKRKKKTDAQPAQSETPATFEEGGTPPLEQPAPPAEALEATAPLTSPQGEAIVAPGVPDTPAPVPAAEPLAGISALIEEPQPVTEPQPQPVEEAQPVNEAQPVQEPAPVVAPQRADESPTAQQTTALPSREPQESNDAIVAEPVVDGAADAAAKTGFFARLRHGLGRTSDNLVTGMGTLFLGRKEIDAALLEDLESRLLLADVGVDATLEIIGRLSQRVSRKELTHPDALQVALREELLALLKPCEQPLQVEGHKPYVILMVGVNGVGKTTTIGKLAKRYIGEGRSVMLAAGDTFRAAAVEQLQVWGERNGVPVVAQHTGADCASVLFDAVQAAQSRGIDVLIADTAGRLHNKDNLMEELKKVVRVMGKLDASAPHEVMLVLDAGTGQNALAQAAQFQQWVGVTGISLTKLDGTAKGGVIFAIAKKLALPIRFIGVGEAADDLRPFQAEQFIEALFAGDDAAA